MLTFGIFCNTLELIKKLLNNHFNSEKWFIFKFMYQNESCFQLLMIDIIPFVFTARMILIGTIVDDIEHLGLVS